MFYVGIDIAKYRHEASGIDAAGQSQANSVSFANSKDDCEKVLGLLGRLGINREDVSVGMEAAGHYWLSGYAYFTEREYAVRVINPIQSDKFRRLYIHLTKNGSRDSFLIAQIMRFD